MALHLAQATVTAFPLLPSAFIDMPYSSGLLLDGRFDASLTDDPQFRSACKSGFEAYFEDMYEDGTSDDVFVDHFYRYDEVVDFLMEWRELSMGDAFFEERFGVHTPLAWHVGFMLGWLSALALTDRELALRGLGVLVADVTRVQVVA